KVFIPVSYGSRRTEKSTIVRSSGFKNKLLSLGRIQQYQAVQKTFIFHIRRQPFEFDVYGTENIQRIQRAMRSFEQTLIKILTAFEPHILSDYAGFNFQFLIADNFIALVLGGIGKLNVSTDIGERVVASVDHYFIDSVANVVLLDHRIRV